MSKIERVSKALPDIADSIREQIESAAGGSVAFSLIVWTEGRFQYISSSHDRQEIKGALQALIDGWDEGMPDIPAHKIN